MTWDTIVVIVMMGGIAFLLLLLGIKSMFYNENGYDIREESFCPNRKPFYKFLRIKNDLKYFKIFQTKEYHKYFIKTYCKCMLNEYNITKSDLKYLIKQIEIRKIEEQDLLTLKHNNDLYTKIFVNKNNKKGGNKNGNVR